MRQTPSTSQPMLRGRFTVASHDLSQAVDEQPRKANLGDRWRR